MATVFVFFMEKLHQKFNDKDFAMVTANIQESSAQVEKFLKKLFVILT